jgi:regulator of sigma E protease
MGFLIALLVLSILIFFHELGHFVAARYFGVKVEVFSIGFGKRLYTKTISGTQWSISAIPLGGYVRMKGQDDSDPTKVNYDSDSYTVKSPLQKIIILLAGPFANFLMAFVLYFAISQLGVPRLKPIIGQVAKDTPAYQAHLQKDDKIVSINNHQIKYWYQIGKLINESSYDIIRFEIVRENSLLIKDIKPKTISEKNIFGENIDKKIIGISPQYKPTSQEYKVVDGLQYALDETLKASMMIFKSIQKMISGDVGADKIGGIITIVDVTAKASQNGILALFFFTALISVNLGVLNLLPIPALDGGHIMFNLYEFVTGKKASDNVMYYLTMFGWALLLGLMLLGVYNDINRILH